MPEKGSLQIQVRLGMKMDNCATSNPDCYDADSPCSRFNAVQAPHLDQNALPVNPCRPQAAFSGADSTIDAEFLLLRGESRECGVV
jgi:hypothetical protein